MKTIEFIFANGARGFELLRPFVREKDIPLLSVLDENEDFRYEVRTVLIPEWMDEREYSINYISYLFCEACGYREEMGEQAYRQFVTYSTVYKVSFFELMNIKNFRSEFRFGLRKRIEHWLSQKPLERRFNQPLTLAQANALLNDRVKKQALMLDKNWRYCHNYVSREGNAWLKANNRKSSQGFRNNTAVCMDQK